MFKLFGKNKTTITPIDRRCSQRRKIKDRRCQVRWEPNKEGRRKSDRRKNLGHWGDADMP